MNVSGLIWSCLILGWHGSKSAVLGTGIRGSRAGVVPMFLLFLLKQQQSTGAAQIRARLDAPRAPSQCSRNRNGIGEGNTWISFLIRCSSLAFKSWMGEYVEAAQETQASVHIIKKVAA